MQHSKLPAGLAERQYYRWTLRNDRRPETGNRPVWPILILCLLLGCARGTKPSANQSDTGDTHTGDVPLRVVVLNNPQLGQAIEREWRSQTQLNFDFQQQTVEDGKLGDRPIDADVLIFPSEWLGQLIRDRQVVAWAQADDSATADEEGPDGYDWQDVLPTIRRQAIVWDGQRYGVSFGESTPILLYRRDLLNAWGLAPPRTWQAYAELQAAIEKQKPAEMITSLEPTSDGWAAKSLLARAASYTRHPNQYSALFQIGTMKPLINEPPFVRALTELAASHAYQTSLAEPIGPNTPIERLIRGQAVMALGTPSAAGTTAEPPGDVEFAIAPLPGSDTTYQFSQSDWQPRENNDARSVPLLGATGYLGAVVRGSSSADAARDFLVWITRDEQATRIARRSLATGPARRSQLEQPTQWVEPSLSAAAGQYRDALADAQASTNGLRLLRIPEQAAYLQHLDQAVLATLRGELSAQEALDQVAQAWTEITASAGQREQQAAYRSSLGL